MATDILRLKLTGLHCADCASKMESAICNLQIIESATVDVINQTATAHIRKETAERDVIRILTEEIHKYEPSVKVSILDESGHNEAVQDEKIAMGAKLLQYGAGFIFISLSFFAQGEPLKISMYMCAYLILGWEVLVKLTRNVIKLRFFDENFLMGIATIGAIALGEYMEAIGVMLFYNIGAFCQQLAVNKSRRSIKSLMSFKPDKANLVTRSGVVTVPPNTIDIGSVILIKPGERVPLDGIIIDGRTQLDNSSLTGESTPVSANEGEIVLSGSINVSGLIKVKTTEIFQQSTAVKILDLVTNASAKKAVTEQFITRFSRYYTPAVVLLAACISIIPPIIMAQPFSLWVERALIFLVVSCPCALVLSVPLGYFAGIGACSKRGILVKGGSYLEALSKAGTIVFDKTGTLTKGVFGVTEIIEGGGFDKNEILRLAAHIESFSNHPIGKSIVSYYDGETNEGLVSGFEEVSGLGVKAEHNGRVCYLGNSTFLNNQNIKVVPFNGIGTAVYIAVDGIYAGCIVVSDEIKEDSKPAVESVKKLGIKTAMLTGDRVETAEKVGSYLGIEHIYSELLPWEKITRLEEIMGVAENTKRRNVTVFVGDGINDAPALARADVSVSMGALGQDAAIEASDIVIMNDNPARIADAVLIARNTGKIVWQNIVFALGVKVIVLSLGAFGLATMWAATFADVGVSLITVFNSMRNK